MSAIEQIQQSLQRIEKMTLLGVKSVLELEDVALLTGYTKEHIYQLTSKREIPHCKKGKKLYFSKSEIEAWMLENKVKTNQEISGEASLYLLKNKK